MPGLGVLFALLILPAAPATDAPRLAVIRAAPAFVLMDQSGRTVRLSDLKGKVLLVSFVFTTCTGSCPATTQRMSLVDRRDCIREVYNLGFLRPAWVADDIALLLREPPPR